MSRAFLALAVGLLAAAVAQADGLPPKGFKRVVVDHKITTDKEIADYTFYTVIYGGKAGPKVTEVKLDPKTPIEIPGVKRTGIGRQGWLVAVPKDAAKKYDSEKAFIEAIQKSKVEGMARTKGILDSTSSVKDTDTRSTIVKEHKFEKIDGATIVLVTKKDEGAPGSKKGGDKKDSADDEDEGGAPGVTAYTPRGGVLIAGLAAALAAMLGGFWLAGRTRRAKA
jgi:hypothetical protein